jgi:hypothetical protein
MKNALRILVATFLGVVVGIAHADNIVTFDVSGSLVANDNNPPYYARAASCLPSGCTLGGTVAIDITNGNFVSSAVTMSGGSPDFGSTPFTFEGFQNGGFVDLQDLGPIESGALYFHIIVPGGTLVGYGGGPLSDYTFILAGPTGYGANAEWDLVSGSLTPEVSGTTPEPSSLLLLGSGLVGFISVMRRKYAKS